MFSLRASIIATSLALALSATAHAQSSAGNDAAAEQLFADGRVLMKSGNYADACAKFDESQKLAPATSTLFNLANCYETNGQTASAWVTFRRAALSAQQIHRADVEADARARAAQLEPKLAYLTLRVAAGANGATVKRDGAVVGDAEIGIAIPVDPGAHAIEATSPRGGAWSGTARIAPAARVVLEVPAFDEAPVAIETRVIPPHDESPVPPTKAGAQRSIAVGTIALGAAGIVVGSIAGIVAASKNAGSKNVCSENAPCLVPSALADNHAAHTAATVSTSAFIAGGALAAIGAALFFTAPSHAATAMRVHVDPMIARDAFGVAVGRAW